MQHRFEVIQHFVKQLVQGIYILTSALNIEPQIKAQINH